MCRLSQCVVALKLNRNAFNDYRCDNDLSLGLQFVSLNKVLKCMGAKDSLQITCTEDEDAVNFIFVSES